LKSDKGFAVVVSDYRMPDMNGVEFLSQAAVLWPNCVRVLLTGEADTRAAGAAVNQGQIFRFLLKPCPSVILEKTLIAAIKHHQLLNNEKSLLEETLRGSMEVMVELLGFANPYALRQSQALYKIMRKLVSGLPVDDKWEFELSALLSEIGNISIPLELLNKVVGRMPLSPSEQGLYLSRTRFAERLLEKIPRLELVAKIIGTQGQPVPPVSSWQALDKVDRFHLGANLLHLAVCWYELSSKAAPVSAFLMEARSLGFPTALIQAAEQLQLPCPTGDCSSVRIRDLEAGMVLVSDLIAKNGLLLLTKGQILSPMLVECMHKRSEYYGADEEVLVKKIASADPLQPV
jgi:CheY-like chemotaxis protein